ncbi:MAG: hypothetical protein KBG02_15775, partial [Haliscomenobacter sp.]|nr:hypothetical protein [Haliscomenobacter sp.]
IFCRQHIPDRIKRIHVNLIQSREIFERKPNPFGTFFLFHKKVHALHSASIDSLQRILHESVSDEQAQDALGHAE